MAKEEIVNEWFNRAQKDIDDAEFLFLHSRPLENIAYLIQQGIEKYLKGFLIYHGWKLEKVHDLVRLVEEAIKIEKSFKHFVSAMRKINEFYLLSRYPVGYEGRYTREEIEEALLKAKELIALIREKTIR